jgi:hypothetical protein
MTKPALRAFSTHCANAGAHRSDFRTQAQSFEDAALRFVERWSGEDEECRIVVIDEDSGERRCLAIHMGRAVTAPC